MNDTEQNDRSARLDVLLRQVLGQDVPHGQPIGQRLQEEIRPPAPEIMTLAEVAKFLRLPEPDLAEVADSLPAFELAGQILVRKSRLLEWIAHREQQHAWAVAHSQESQQRHASLWKGVA